MAQIHVMGIVSDDIIHRDSLNETAYACFHLREQLGKGRFQTFQVWVWGSVIARLLRLKIKKGSMIWVTGSMELVDCTVNAGKNKTKILKVYCSDIGYIPYHRKSEQAVNSSAAASAPQNPPEIDGDREQLPE